jgi:hypothetical protein
MPVDGEFTDPVGYSGSWLLVALVLVALVVLYYAWAWRSGAEAQEPFERVDRGPGPRERSLHELQRLEAAVRGGSMPVRTGFQRLSLTVRSFAEDTTGVPARAMTLEELRAAADPRVAEAIAEMYPPEFAPETADAHDFARSLARARELVSSWT